MAAKLRSKSARPTSFLRLAYSAPTPHDNSQSEEIRHFMLPAAKALPFVKLRANDQPMWRPETFWSVEPTGKREMDVRLGRNYAREALAAMKADGNNHLIAYIIQDIIKDAIESKGKKGRGRRNGTMLGFLSEISETIAATPLPQAVNSAHRGSR